MSIETKAEFLKDLESDMTNSLIFSDVTKVLKLDTTMKYIVLDKSSVKNSYQSCA